MKGKKNDCIDDNEETIMESLKAFHEQTKPVLEYYWRLGLVRSVDSSKSVKEVFEQVKKAISPNIIFFYGPICVGKSRIGKMLCDRLNYEFIELESFYKKNNCHDDITKANKLIEYFLNSPNINFIVDSFLENINQANIFFKQISYPKIFFYFKATNDEIHKAINDRFEENDPKIEIMRNKYTKFAENREQLLNLINKNVKNIIEVDVYSSLDCMHDQILQHLIPQVYVANSTENKELWEEYAVRLEKERGQLIINNK